MPVLSEWELSGNDLQIQIDAEILELQERIRLLRTKRNTLSPISCLAPEILAQVFLIAQDSLFDNLDLSETRRYREWMGLVQVSQHWREVALGFASLWMKIRFTHRTWVRACLERSRSALLTVKLLIHDQRDLSIAQLVLGELHRISHLQIFIVSRLWQEICPLLCLPAPNLESVSISAISPVHQSLPDDIFSDEAPSLRRVTLVGCSCNIQSSMFAGGHLTNLGLMPGQPYHIDTILQLLQSLPELTSLRLKEAISPARTAHATAPPTHLPHLISLDIGHKDTEIDIHILELLTLPRTALMMVSTLETTPIPHIIQYFPRLLSTALNAYQGLISVTGATYEWDSPRVVYSARSEAVSPDNAQIKFAFFTEEEDTVNQAAANDMFAQTPDIALQDLNFVQIETPGVVILPEVWKKLGRIRGLRYMLLGECSSTSLLNYLIQIGQAKATSSSDVGGAEDANIDGSMDAFPALRELGLWFLAFDQLSLLDLSHMFSIRKQEGRGLERMEIAMEEGEVLQQTRDELEERLKDIVKLVQWQILEPE